MLQAQVWYKELENGDRAVAAYNSGIAAKDIEVDFSDVGFAVATRVQQRNNDHQLLQEGTCSVCCRS